jgi:serine protease Do
MKIMAHKRFQRLKGLKSRPALFLVLALALIIAGLLGYLLGRSGGPLEKSQNNVAQEVPKPSSDIPNDEPIAQVASQVSPSVVQVNVREVQATPFGPQEGEGVGSGVIYRKDGYLVTNAHVVQDSNWVNVAFADGSTERGNVVGKDETTDIAVVKVNRNDLPAAKFGNSRDLIVGQGAVAIGSPSGFQSTVTSGVISGLNREVPADLTGGQQDVSLVALIQTDAAISPGNSGGALADQNGEVIGINVAYLPPAQTGAENIAFAIPSDTATSVADQLINNGQAVHPYLGVSLADLTPGIAKQFGIAADSGALVTEVASGGPAEKAGIKQKDVVTALGLTKIKDAGDLIAALRDYKPGDSVTLTINRNGEQSNVELTLGDRSQ